MSLNKKNARYYYSEIQKLLDKYKTDDGQVEGGFVCRDLFNMDNPVISEQDLKNDCADYSGRCAIPWHGKKDPKCEKGSEFHSKLYTKCFNSN
jgi:hypothetical protein